jgi:hypothetical protein
MTSPVTRPRAHIDNVRADALKAAERAAARTGAEPSTLIPDTISWALGKTNQAPFSCTQAPQASYQTIMREIEDCDHFLQTTPWSEHADRQISRAHRVHDLLQWLIGTTDLPPTYCRDTEPGDLVGGRGRIVRPEADIRRMLAQAQTKLASGQTSHALGTDWHEGVIATFQWVVGDCALTPILGHAATGRPNGGQVTAEKGEAEDYLAAPLGRPDIPYHYGDAVACTCRWLLGSTTQPPATADHQG